MNKGGEQQTEVIKPSSDGFAELINGADAGNAAAGTATDAPSADASAAEATPPGQTGQTGQSTQGGQSAQQGGFIDTLRSQLSAQGYSEDQLKDLNEKNWQSVVASKAAPKIHPEAAALQKALDSGMTVEQYYQARNEPARLIALSDKDLYAENLRAQYGKSEQNPDGWSEERISELVAAKEATGTLPIDAEQIRMEIRKQVAREQSVEATQPAASVPDKNTSMDAATLAKFNEAVSASVKSIATQGGFYGIETGDFGDVNNLSARAVKLLTPDPKTGQSVTEARLSSNDGYLRAAILLDMAETGQLKALLNGKAEAVRRSILDQLELTPGTNAGAAATQGGAIDLDALSRPSGAYAGRG